MKQTDEENRQTARKPVPLWLMIPMDAMLIAACLLTFAYFHHVRPQAMENELEHDVTAFIPSENPYTRPSSNTSTTTVQVAEQTQDGISDTEAQNSDQTADQTTGVSSSSDGTVTAGTDVTQGAQSGSSASGASSSQTAGTVQSSSTSVTTSTTAAPLTPDLSGWGAKWPDKFSYGYDVVQTANSYRSHDLNVSIETLQYGDSVAYVADIYIRYLDNFRSAFAKDTYGRSIYENTVSLVTRNNAVIAVNGDYYATRDTGVIVRNFTAYRNVPKGDVGALYYDGTFRSFTKTEFDLDTEMAKGLYQTMSFAPALVKDGQVLSGFTSSVAKELAPRTGFGYYEPGHYALVVVDGRQPGYSTGITWDEFAALFGQLGCTEAFNLDGGQTSQMLFMGEVYNRPYKYDGTSSSLRALPDIFFAAEVE